MKPAPGESLSPFWRCIASKPEKSVSGESGYLLSTGRGSHVTRVGLLEGKLRFEEEITDSKLFR